MDDDLRDRIAESAARWALMYPIAAWSLGREEHREKLAANWGTGIADAVMPAVQSELDRLTTDADLAESTARHQAKRAQRWVKYARVSVKIRRQIEAERDGWEAEAKTSAGNADYWRQRAEQAEATIARVRVLAKAAKGAYGALCCCPTCEDDWAPATERHEPTWTAWSLDPAAVLAALDQPEAEDR